MIQFDYFRVLSPDKDMTLSTQLYDKRGIKGLFEFRYSLDQKSRGQFNGGFLNDAVFENQKQDDSLKTNLGKTRQRAQRFFLEYDHHYEMPGHLTQRTSLNYLSDLRYIRDFPEDILSNPFDAQDTKKPTTTSLEATQPALENNISLTKNTENQSLSLEGAFHINLLQEDAKAKNNESIHRLPELHYSLMEKDLLKSGLMFNLDLRYTHFLRNRWSYDNICNNESCLDGKSVTFSDIDFNNTSLSARRVDSQRDGSFDPTTDLIRTGQRLLITPSFNYPILLKNKFELVPSATYYHRLYHFSPTNDNAASYKKITSHNHLETKLSMKTRISRTFRNVFKRNSERPDNSDNLEISDNSDNSDNLDNLEISDKNETKRENSKNATVYKHIVEPQISYVHTPFYKVSPHPFFGNSPPQTFSQNMQPLTDLDFLRDGKIQFDYHDNFFLKKMVHFGVTNKIIRKKHHHEGPSYLEVASLEINQSYDFHKKDSKDSQPFNTIDSLLTLRLDHIEFHGSNSYFPYAKALRTSNRLRLKSQLGSFLELIYSKDPIISEDNNKAVDNQNETGGVGFGFVSRYFNFEGGFNYSFKNRSLQSWDARTILKPEGNCWAIALSFHQTPNSDETKFSYNVLFEFGNQF